MVGLAVGGELALKGLDGLPERKCPALGHVANCPHQLLEQVGVREVQSRERNPSRHVWKAA